MGLDTQALGPRAATVQPVKLAGRVRVGVDGEPAAGLDGQAQQPVGRVVAVEINCRPERQARDSSSPAGRSCTASAARRNARTR
jgi:hypothetical protein